MSWMGTGRKGGSLMDPGRQTVETWAQVGMFHLTDWPEFKKKASHIAAWHVCFVNFTP